LVAPHEREDTDLVRSLQGAEGVDAYGVGHVHIFPEEFRPDRSSVRVRLYGDSIDGRTAQIVLRIRDHFRPTVTFRLLKRSRADGAPTARFCNLGLEHRLEGECGGFFQRDLDGVGAVDGYRGNIVVDRSHRLWKGLLQDICDDLCVEARAVVKLDVV